MPKSIGDSATFPAPLKAEGWSQGINAARVLLLRPPCSLYFNVYSESNIRRKIALLFSVMSFDRH
jgi:hypothetical protein